MLHSTRRGLHSLSIENDIFPPVRKIRCLNSGSFLMTRLNSGPPTKIFLNQYTAGILLTHTLTKLNFLKHGHSLQIALTLVTSSLRIHFLLAPLVLVINSISVSFSGRVFCISLFSSCAHKRSRPQPVGPNWDKHVCFGHLPFNA